MVLDEELSSKSEHKLDDTLTSLWGLIIETSVFVLELLTYRTMS